MYKLDVLVYYKLIFLMDYLLHVDLTWIYMTYLWYQHVFTHVYTLLCLCDILKDFVSIHAWVCVGHVFALMCSCTYVQNTCMYVDVYI